MRRDKRWWKALTTEEKVILRHMESYGNKTPVWRDGYVRCGHCTELNTEYIQGMEKPEGVRNLCSSCTAIRAEIVKKAVQRYNEE